MWTFICVCWHGIGSLGALLCWQRRHKIPTDKPRESGGGAVIGCSCHLTSLRKVVRYTFWKVISVPKPLATFLRCNQSCVCVHNRPLSYLALRTNKKAVKADVPWKCSSAACSLREAQLWWRVLQRPSTLHHRPFMQDPHLIFLCANSVEYYI